MRAQAPPGTRVLQKSVLESKNANQMGDFICWDLSKIAGSDKILCLDFLIMMVVIALHNRFITVLPTYLQN